MFGVIGFLLIGLAAGWLAGRIFKGRGFGLAGNLLVGVIGSMLGGIVFRLLGISADNTIGSLVTASVGAIVFLWALCQFREC